MMCCKSIFNVPLPGDVDQFNPISTTHKWKDIHVMLKSPLHPFSEMWTHWMTISMAATASLWVILSQWIYSHSLPSLSEYFTSLQCIKNLFCILQIEEDDVTNAAFGSDSSFFSSDTVSLPFDSVASTTHFTSYGDNLPESPASVLFSVLILVFTLWGDENGKVHENDLMNSLGD